MKRILLMLVLPLCMINCYNHTEVGSPPDLVEEQLDEFDPLKPVVFGARIENPYSVENMREAFNALPESTRAGLSAEKIVQATHYYLKLTFRDDTSYDYVIQDTTLNLFYYPVDVEIVSGGYWEDEGYIDGKRIRYASVPVKKMQLINNSGAKYEVLDDLFLPDNAEYADDGFITRSGVQLTEQQVRALVEKSFILTGNEKMIANSANAQTRALKRPSGYITYENINTNNSVSMIGLYGVKIRATR